MRIAITGTTGRVGAALSKHLSVKHEVIELPRSVCDFAEPGSLLTALDGLECDVLLNPAAMTSVEESEKDSRTAMRVNSGAPGKIALWAAERGVRVIHFSTDYVFGGQMSGLRVEGEPAMPLNAYGRSKLAGERAVLAHAGNLVLRVSWVFGLEKASFVDQVMQLALAREPIAGVADKWSIPTCTKDLAEWVEGLLETNAEGILHACNSGEPTSWYDMAKVVVDEMKVAGRIDMVPEVIEQKVSELPTFLAERPIHTAMDNSRLASVIEKPIRPWEEALREYVRFELPTSNIQR